MMMQVLSQLSLNPAKILGLLNKGLIKEEYDADITLIDPVREWIVDADKFASRCRNRPFSGKTFSGKAVVTILGGRVIHKDHS